jgi:spore germination protein YaaH
MLAKNPVRYLAPVALIAVAVAVGLLVKRGLESTHHAATLPVAHQATTATHVASRRLFYVIKPGDTLSRISVRTGVPIATLEALNPSLQNPNALQTGVRLRLRR